MNIFLRAGRKLSKIVRQRFYAPAIKIDSGVTLVHLGSRYGGWSFEPSADLHGAAILSCGLGEDASFDVEFAAKFGARVILVDPTPRAIEHYNAIGNRLGQAAARNYAQGGNQPVEAYDLSSLEPGSLVLEPVALWKENTTLKFFAPATASDVSYSITNYQHNYSTDTAFIEVPAETPDRIFEKHGLADVPLIKLDIEGAETAVLDYMVQNNILPRQILIELDELHVPSPRSRDIAHAADKALRDRGYRCFHSDGISNFTYIRP